MTIERRTFPKTQLGAGIAAGPRSPDLDPLGRSEDLPAPSSFGGLLHPCRERPQASQFRSPGRARPEGQRPSQGGLLGSGGPKAVRSVAVRPALHDGSLRNDRSTSTFASPRPKTGFHDRSPVRIDTLAGAPTPPGNLRLIACAEAPRVLRFRPSPRARTSLRTLPSIASISPGFVPRDSTGRFGRLHPACPCGGGTRSRQPRSAPAGKARSIAFGRFPASVRSACLDMPALFRLVRSRFRLPKDPQPVRPSDQCRNHSERSVSDTWDHHRFGSRSHLLAQWRTALVATDAPGSDLRFPCGTSSFDPVCKSMISLRFLASSSSSYSHDAVIKTESHKAEKPLPGLWITWITVTNPGRPNRRSSLGAETRRR
jgi:hypothetical protein